ncbi:UBX domain-containing protein 4 isoform X2 [Callorhinchus milii]|uniref:UBX domain-containing protein 4 isoform X2 n=1 Tax=Callorhinchus milii TaxID=7868 RepID=UPI000457542C|nr:UBX domain-containing protein 4 isoform X2 [Callorhinchus milii]|eukprot:gi/632957294/ref/XP_007894399.1/ PREDICTED: UBX domain-containing protein 4 isoform X2 [Callorhinchus milii]
MRWFGGSIPAAIGAAKHDNAVFVVFITENDELSTQMAACWEAEEIAEATADSFVAIKIDAESESCLQFSQIYPVVCIPSSFFIGNDGIPLEVIAGSISTEELLARIQKVKQMHAERNAGGANNETNLDQIQATTSNAEATNAEKTNESHGVIEIVQPRSPPPPCAKLFKKSSLKKSEAESLVSEGLEVGSIVTEMSSAEEIAYISENMTGQEEELDIRVERLSKKLEDKRDEKKKTEAKIEIKTELERRKVNKDMMDFKRKQDEDRTKRLLEERTRDKEEERLARERIRQQIALDRADRAARYAKTKEDTEVAKRAAEKVKQAEEEAKRKALQNQRSKMSRLQFRLPDGSSFTNQFPSDAHLSVAREFAERQVGGVYGSFELATTFPRREFTNEDYNRTLTELELVPSASIILVPGGRSPSSVLPSSGGGFWDFMNVLFYPLITVWRLLSSYIFGSGTMPRSSGRDVSQQENSRPSTSRPSTSIASDSDREVRRRRLLENRGEDFKREGKIYRLRTEGDADDENNTWNGNSTQQM